MPLFFVALGVTELGSVFGIAVVLLAAWGFRPDWAGWVGLLFTLPAAGLFWSSAVRALLFARRKELPSAKLSGTVHEKCLPSPGGSIECFFGPGGERRPLIYVVHGGSWKGGSPRECRGFLRKLAKMGCFVASGSYRFSSVAPWPAQREDVRAGLQTLLSRAGELGIDPGRVFLLGRSAGGQVASATACAPGDVTIRGCIVFYAPFDMNFAYDCGREDDVLRSPSLLRDLLGGPPGEAVENYRTASAFHLARKGAPPFLLFHGTRDELVSVWQSRRFAARLREEGVPCRFLELPWATHGFDHISFGPSSGVALAAIRKFIG